MLIRKKLKEIILSFHYKNAVVLGYFLVNWALILNILSDDKLGVVFAVLSMASCYFLETMRVNGIANHNQWIVANVLSALMVGSVVTSYLCWIY